MKYAKYLAKQAIPEWQAHYFKYKKLKKELKVLVRVSEFNPSNFSTAQQAYIDLLYEELESVNKFFEDKEKELVDQYSQLKTLLADSWLQGSKRSFLTFSKQKDKTRAIIPNTFNDQDPSPPPSPPPELPPASAGPSLQALHLSAETPSESLKRPPIRDSEAPKGFAPSSSKGVPLARRYKFAIKRSIEEVHRGLSMLKNFATMNSMGFRKIIKKHDKVPKFPTMAYFLEQEVYKSHFHTSTTADTLLAELEAVYANIFTGGNLRQAADKLRIPTTHHQHDWSSFRFGGCIGACIVIALYLTSVPPSTVMKPDYGEYVMFAFRFLGVPVLWLWTFATVMLIWDSVRINYVFIFGWDPRKRISPGNLCEISAALSLLWLAAFAGYYSSLRDDHLFFRINGSLYPLIVLGLVVIFLVLPFNGMYRSSRLWMLQTVGRIVRTPMLPVKFSDFFYTNQFNSLKFAFSDMGDTLYFYIVAIWADDTPQNRTTWNNCSLIYRPILQLYAGVLRFLQCARRYRETKDFRHLINMAKYTCSVLTVIFAGIRRAYPQSVPILCLFCIIATISTCYSWVWDILMDWDLGYVKYRMLRRKLMYTHPWKYYLAAFLDLSFRAVWAVALGSTESGFSLNPMNTIVSVTEVVRRFIWNIFRLENEHLKNCLQSNATEIPALIKAYREMNTMVKDSSTAHVNFTVLANKLSHFGEDHMHAHSNTHDYEDAEADVGVEGAQLDLMNETTFEGIRHRRVMIDPNIE